MMRTGSAATGLHRAMMAACAGVMFAALGACGGTPLFMPDGRPTTQVQCQFTDSDSCAAQARAQCGDAGLDAVDNSTSGDVHTLVFACRRQDSAQNALQ